MKNIINNEYSTARRPYNKITAANYSNFTKKVNTVKGTKVNTARPKAVLSAVKGNKGNAVKASACWVWRPKHKVLDHISKNNGASLSIKRFDYINAQGRSKHMTGNRFYLTDYEEIDEGFVAFGGNSKGGKISGKDSKSSPNTGFKASREKEKKDAEDPGNEDSEVPSTEEPRVNQEKDDNVSSTNNVNTTSVNSTNTINIVSQTVNVAGIEINVVDPKSSIELPDDPNMPELEDIIYSDDDEDVGAEADINNLDAVMPVSLIPTTRIHKDHPVEQIIEDLHSAPQTRIMTKNLEEHGLYSSVQQRINHKDFQNCLFACFLSQEEPKKMDVKSAFLYGKIEEGVYVCQPLGSEDPNFPDRVYKVKKGTLWIASSSQSLKFGFTDVKTASTPMETQKPLLKDADGKDVYEHLYRSMIGSLMYLTSSRPDIMFAVCACVRFQVNPKSSHLHAVKRIFRYLKGQPKLGLWYPKDSPFDLVAYTDSDYVGASLDRKSTTGGCQFLGCRLISWQCKEADCGC
ncbi:uncharacterized mitochondrial protein-like protein [Tanacetum coccineum]